MKTPFSWPQTTVVRHEERNVVEQHESQGVINSSGLEVRETYIGSRRSHSQHKIMEDLFKGSIEDIKEGCMLFFNDLRST